MKISLKGGHSKSFNLEFLLNNFLEIQNTNHSVVTFLCDEYYNNFKDARDKID